MELKDSELIVDLRELKAKMYDMHIQDLTDADDSSLEVVAADILLISRVVDLIQVIGRKG